MAEERRIDERLIFATRPDTCTECKRSIAVDTSIWWNTHTRKARHKHCPVPDINEQKNAFDAWIDAFQKMEGGGE